MNLIKRLVQVGEHEKSLRLEGSWYSNHVRFSLLEKENQLGLGEMGNLTNSSAFVTVSQPYVKLVKLFSKPRVYVSPYLHKRISGRSHHEVNFYFSHPRKTSCWLALTVSRFEKLEKLDQTQAIFNFNYPQKKRVASQRDFSSLFYDFIRRNCSTSAATIFITLVPKS